MKTIDAAMFRAMITNGYLDLKKHLQEINDLNVFPVPDGDTGSNMGATMEGGVHSFRPEVNHVGVLAKDMAQAMLLTARGNSGVILSQFFAGLAEHLAPFAEVPLKEYALAMRAGVKTAYSVVLQPVEGTILTVMREGCEAAFSAIEPGTSYAEYFTVLVAKMKDSLEHTPELLPVLKEAGVIDSGGAGLVYIIEGMAQAIGGRIIEEVTFDFDEPAKENPNIAFDENSALDYGYCTNFLLQLTTAKDGVKRFRLQEMIDYYQSVGDSLVALQNGALVKVHVHTKTPDVVIAYALQYGEFVMFKLDNMALQHNETLIEKSRHRAMAVMPAQARISQACISVAPTEEIAEQFRQYGVNLALVGGSLMNPSADQFVSAFKKVNADSIIVLPNNKNEILVAEQASKFIEGSKIVVLPAHNLAQGLSAASVFDGVNIPFEDNLARMNSQIEHATSLAVAKASKETEVNGTHVAVGNYLGILDGKVVSFGKDAPSAFAALLDSVPDFEDRSLLTLFYGKDVPEEEKSAIEASALEKNDFLEVYPFFGNQEIYCVLALLE